MTYTLTGCAAPRVAHGALAKGNHQHYVDQPGKLGGDDAVADGNVIPAACLAARISVARLPAMLPVAAGMVTGSMRIQATAGGMSGGSEPTGGPVPAPACMRCSEPGGHALVWS